MPIGVTEGGVHQERYTPNLPRGFWRRHYNLGGDVVDGEFIVGAKHDPHVDLTIRHANGFKISLKTKIKSFLGLFGKIEKVTEEEVQNAIEVLLMHEDVSLVETPEKWRNF